MSAPESSRCCRCSLGWRDICMFTLEGATTALGAAAVGYAAKGAISMLAPGGVGVILIGEVVVHLFWHRDGVAANLRQTVQDLAYVEEGVHDAAERTDDAVRRLTEENQRLAAERDALQKAATAFDAQMATLRGQVESLQATEGRLTAANADLGTRNADLERQVAQLQEVINGVKAQLAKFNDQNNALKGDLDGLGHAVEVFGREDDSLKVVLTEVDRALDEDVADLAKQVQMAQQSSHEVFGLLSGKIHELKTTIGELGDAEGRLDRDEDDIRARQAELAELEKQLAATESALEQRKVEFLEINKAMGEAQAKLSATLEKLGKAGEGLEGDNKELHETVAHLSDLASHLDALGARISSDVDGIKAMGDRADAQSAVIDGL